MYIILCCLIIGITFVLFIKEEVEMVLISREYPYSIYHTDIQEKISIELLSNTPQSYHFSTDYIIDATIHNESEELSVIVQDIQVSDEEILYKETPYYQIIIDVSVSFTSTDLLVSIKDAYLELTYENMEVLDVKIGDVVYLFDETVDTDITLGNLSATHERVKGYNTVSGVNLNVANSSNRNIMITDITVLSNRVFIDKENVNRLITCPFDTPVAVCIGVENYDFNKEFKDIPLSILLGKNNDIELYLPLLFDKETDFIYELSIVLTYQIDQEERRMIIDDFPYMKTSIFSNIIEEDIHVYKITNSDS